jgi:hypothetical protein
MPPVTDNPPPRRDGPDAVLVGMHSRNLPANAVGCSVGKPDAAADGNPDR